ncbi:hypothetical protein HN51_039683, partial [Arachis hypogaea]
MKSFHGALENTGRKFNNGFKKEQLKVQTNNKGLLTIFGERPLDSSNNKWSRFHKEIRLPKDTNVNEISAKLSHGVLSIVMPKKVEEHYSSSTGELKTRKRTAIKLKNSHLVAAGVATA